MKGKEDKEDKRRTNDGKDGQGKTEELKRVEDKLL